MHSFKYAFRFLSRNKLFTGINILGLALSLACSIVLSRYLYREMTVDRHAIDPETIYVAFRNWPGGHRAYSLYWTKEQYDKTGQEYLDRQIVETCDISPYPEEFVRLGNQIHSCKMIMVDSTFTHFFDYPLLGDANALKQSNACWISEECAKSFDLTPQDALGCEVEIMSQSLRIAGVFHNPEGQVILNPDLILPARAFRYLSHIPFGLMRVRPDFDAAAVNEKLTTFGETEEHQIMWGNVFQGHDFVSWSDYYFSHETGEQLSSRTLRYHGNATLCWILLAVLLLIMIIGVVNFINLYLVQWQRRQREAGVRRVFGRKALRLFFDLWSELFLSVFASVVIAWGFVELSTPWIDDLLGNTTAGTYFDILFTVCILVFLPLMAMLYPFVQQWHTSPLKSLQQKTGSVQSLKARTLILGFQYFITLALVVIALWMRLQLGFLLDSPLGFDPERILLVRPAFINESWVVNDEGNPTYQSNREEVETAIAVYVDRLKQSPLVEQYCHTNTASLPINNLDDDKYFNDKAEECMLRFYWVPEQWFEVFGITLEQGTFPVAKAYLSDSESEKPNGMLDGWIANRSALHRLGYQSLDAAYARRERGLIYTSDGEFGNEQYPIKALVNDHYAEHRTLGVTACIYCLEDEVSNSYWREDSYLAIRVRPEGMEPVDDHGKTKISAFIDQLQEELFPNQRLESRWMSDLVEKQYRSDRVMADVYLLFSAIAIVISCLGLLGLSMFDIRQRYREIAIRKANGAHRKDIYLRLGLKYLYTLLATFVLSIPVTYLLIHRYTESFVEFAPLTPWIYLEALAIVMAITALTLISQLEKAARVNVSTIIKTE